MHLVDRLKGLRLSFELFRQAKISMSSASDSITGKDSLEAARQLASFLPSGYKESGLAGSVRGTAYSLVCIPDGLRGWRLGDLSSAMRLPRANVPVLSAGSEGQTVILMGDRFSLKRILQLSDSFSVPSPHQRVDRRPPRCSQIDAHPRTPHAFSSWLLYILGKARPFTARPSCFKCCFLSGPRHQEAKLNHGPHLRAWS